MSQVNTITYLPLYRAYPQLANPEDVGDEIQTVGNFILQAESQISPLFGSTFLCYINQCAAQLDMSNLYNVSQYLDICVKQNQSELSPIMPLIAEIQNITTQIDLLFKNLIDVATYEKHYKIFENNCMKKCNSNFGLELAASYFLMKKINDYFQDQKTALEMNTLLMGNVLQLLPCQLELICKLLNINCEFYQEYEDNFIYSFCSVSSPNQRMKHILILSQDSSSVRFGYAFTSRKMTKFIRDSYIQNLEDIQIMKSIEDKVNQSSTAISEGQKQCEQANNQLILNIENNNKMEYQIQIFKNKITSMISNEIAQIDLTTQFKRQILQCKKDLIKLK